MSRSKREDSFQFDAILSSSMIDMIETREKFKKDAEMEDITKDWNIYLVRVSEFSGRKRKRKLAKDEIDYYLKIENRNKKPAYSLADYKRDIFSECP